MFRWLIWVLLLLPISTLAQCIGSPNCTVKAAGGGGYTTIQACASAMAAGDTCTVFSGTYSESPTVPAGAVGNYKTITVNGTDVVSVLGFTLNSHTKLIGNCPTLQGTILTATCGFFISKPASPNSAACVFLPNGSSDVYIRKNVAYACGSGAQIVGTNVNHIFIQGNTLSYACITQAQAGTALKECDGVLILGDHLLVENNDMSHYTLGIDINVSFGMYRNNVMHDQVETEAGGNAHTDWWFSEPGNATFPTQFNVLESNRQYNGFGPNAKGVLAQADTACGGVCDHLIERFNWSSRIGSAYNSNNGTATWGSLMIYNNTIVDAGLDCNCITGQGDIDNSEKTTNGSFLNQLYYQSGPSNFSGFNFYACSNNATNPPASSLCSSGHSLYFCAVFTCTTVYGQTYEAGTWLGEAGNKIADPKFVSYLGIGNLANDYHLLAGSPAIAAGINETTVNGTISNSTTLVVNRASYFQDGYGLSNAYSTVFADCIAVTLATNQVCIISINYSTNTLTLASPISATNGDPVWLKKDSNGTVQLFGAQPNMGAFQSAAGLAPPTNLQGQPITISTEDWDAILNNLYASLVR